MEILVKRKYRKTDYTIGAMFIDGVYFCDTVEDCDRGLSQAMSNSYNEARKVYGKTAIPIGRYRVVLSYSNKFKKTLPEIKDVMCFSGVRIHSGNTSDDSLGCIIVGENKIKGGVINSRVTLERIMAKLRGQKEIFITIE